MSTQLHKTLTLINLAKPSIISLPVPKTLSPLWNTGSLLSIILLLQIVSGLILAISYLPSTYLTFNAIYTIIDSNNFHWLLRYTHINGASLFFFLIYLHIARGIFHQSYLYTHTWSVGLTIFILAIVTAFLGYVLPVNQISYWGVSVITNLFSEVPYIGPTLVQLIWGDLTVRSATLIRFFTLHYLIPLIILILVIVHLAFLHTTGSRNPLGLNHPSPFIYFHPYFSAKDTLGFLITLLLFTSICLLNPLMFGDDDNFITANQSTTPLHIQPEWYFLFAYAILRSIPSKLGGVIALFLSVLIFYLLPLTPAKKKSLHFTNKLLFWLFIFTVILLTCIGANPVEYPYILLGQLLSLNYFLFFILHLLIIR